MKTSYLKVKILYLLVFSLFISCKKGTESDANIGPATLSVELTGIQSDRGDYPLNKIANTNTKELSPSVLEIPLNKELSAYVTLEEENNSVINTKLKPSNKLASKELSPITPGVLYGILVYDGNTLIPNGHKIFTAGQEALSTGFALDGGKTYTFIGYSRNSTSIPTVSNINTLSDARINDESGDLLYFRHIQTVSTGNNNLKVTLRHKFTSVTTEIKVGTTYAGKIQEITNGLFSNLSASASIKLSDSTITYKTPANTTSSINFTPIATGGVTSKISSRNLLIAATSNTVTYNFPSIKVNDAIGVIPATAFNMQAGKKYNLIITLDVPCARNNSPVTFNISNGQTVNLNNINGNYGMTFDIDQIDDSFNINVNGVNLFEASYRQAVRSGNQTRTRTRTRTRTQSVNSIYNYDDVSQFPSDFWNSPNNTSWVYSDYSEYSKWSAQNFGTYSTTPYEAADLAFIYNGQAAYINAKFTNQPTWGWSWNTTNNTDYIYNINNGDTNPTVPTIRVVVSSNNQISLSARKSNSDPDLYPIFLQTNPALSSNTVSDDLTTFPSNYYLKSTSITTPTATTPTYSTSTYSNYTKTPILNVILVVIGYTYTRIETQIETSTETRNVNQTIADQITFRQNTISWNTSGANNVVLSQKVVGNTNARGKIYTRTKVNCTTNQ